MLLVEHHAEQKLIERLEYIRAEGSAMNCLELGFSKLPEEVRLSQSEIVRLVRDTVDQQSNEVQLYFGLDGDVYMVCERMLMKELRQIAAQLPVGQHTTLRHYELDFQVNTLLVQLEEKVTRMRAVEEALRAQQEQQKQARKRAQILSYSPDAAAIVRARALRTSRLQPEILIVEDDVFSRRLLENVLPKHFAVSAIGESERVLEHYALHMPDIVFLDINLPDVNGHDLLDRIMTIDPDAYVIMISGNADRENVVRAMSRGACGFIAKPFARERLYDYINRCPTAQKA